MKTTLKNFDNQENKDIIKKQADKVYDDATILLYDIRHTMGVLSQISLIVESIMHNAWHLSSEYKEEILDCFPYKYEYLMDTDSFLDELNGKYTINMVEFIEDIQQLLGEYQDISLDKHEEYSQEGIN